MGFILASPVVGATKQYGLVNAFTLNSPPSSNELGSCVPPAFTSNALYSGSVCRQPFAWTSDPSLLYLSQMYFKSDIDASGFVGAEAVSLGHCGPTDTGCGYLGDPIGDWGFAYSQYDPYMLPQSDPPAAPYGANTAAPYFNNNVFNYLESYPMVNVTFAVHCAPPPPRPPSARR